VNPDYHHKALPKGDHLHWYRIDSILGQGGFGITYLAEDTNLEQRVAIKEYLPNELAVRVDGTTVQPISEEHGKMYRWGLDRFLTEAKTLAKFKHPNIVRVQSFFEQNNTAYMVMEYEDGQSLAQVIKAGQLRGEQALLGLLDPILDGLSLVHEAGFIHRDIKPDNIFIRADDTPVLLDFGSARHAISGQTRTLTSLVTPGYAPFEQYHDADGKQGPWTDIYAIGATFYRAITGNTPVEAIKRGMARIDHSTDPYLPLADLKAGEYSEHFLEALDCSLRFLEADRPQTVNSWQRMLHGAEPVPPQPELAAPARPAPSTGGTQAAAPAASGSLDIDFDRPDTLAPTTPAPQTIPTAPQTTPQAGAAVAPPAESAAPPVKRTGLWIGASVTALVVAASALWLTQLRQPEVAPAVVTKPTPAQVVVSNEQRIADFAGAAEAAIAAGRLIEPEDESALTYYRRILNIDPTHSEAQSGIAKLLDMHIQAANRALDARDLDTARGQIAGAERIDPKALGLQLIREKLASIEAAETQRRVAAQAEAARTQQAQQQRVAKLLGEAQTLAGAANYTQAIDRYKEVLALDAGNAVAKSGMRTAEAQLQSQRKRQAAAEQRRRDLTDALAEGERQLKAHRLARAEAAFRTALKLDPGNRTAQAGIAQVQQAIAARKQAAQASAAAKHPYTLAILPWSLRGTDNYEQSIFRGLQQALQSRSRSLRLTHSHYRNFDAGKSSKRLSDSGVGGSDLQQVWVKKQGMFSQAELNERGARTIAKRLGVDAVLLARVSIATGTAQIDLYFLEQRSGTAKRASGQLHFPVWGYHEESAARVKALLLKVLPARI
jgi:serine/threonine protein kinase